jgi:REP element-mobilizing transposase RayT
MARGTWHIVGRGVRRLALCIRPEDFRKYLDLLARAAAKHGCDVHAYALMPNHYHLLLTGETGPIGKCMHATNRPYSRWFNDRHELKGHTFEATYRRFAQRSTPWALRTSAYIHLNPVSARLSATAEGYPWSSAGAYLGRGTDLPGLAIDPILRALDPDPRKARAMYRDFLKSFTAGHIPGGPSADQVWTHHAKALLREVKASAPRVDGVTPELITVLLGRRAGIPMKTLAKVCGLHDPNTAHVLAYRLKRKLAARRALAAPLRRWAGAMGLDLPGRVLQ